MGQITFGFGDTTGHNNWTFSGTGQGLGNEWEWSSFATGQFGRIVALAARWSGYTSGVGAGFCSNPSGQSAAWASAGNHGPDLTSSSYGASTVSAGGNVAQLNNAGTSDYWQNNGTFWTGFTTGGCLYFTGTTNVGGYTGGTGGPGGGTNNWGGSGAFGFGTYGTVQVTLIFVKRGGVWTQARVYVKRGGTWGTAYVQVKRSGAFTGALNMVEWLQKSEQHIPNKGLPVEVNVGEGWEPGWLVETGEYGWFGSINPEILGVEWRKPGHWTLPQPKFTGRYNSAEPEEVADARLNAYYMEDRALRLEKYDEARYWHKRWQPDSLVSTRGSFIVSPGFQSVDPDPEPIIVPCGCA